MDEGLLLWKRAGIEMDTGEVSRLRLSALLQLIQQAVPVGLPLAA